LKKILVTGGYGFIGSNFIRMLLTEDASELVINYDKQTYAGNPENLGDFENYRAYQLIKADICDQESIARTLSDYEVDAIVNFAAESHVDRSIDGPEPFVQTNVVGTLRLLDMVPLNRKIRLFPRLPLMHRIAHTLHPRRLPII
jgi:dTDP-glucose 4,6-dehydratase